MPKKQRRPFIAKRKTELVFDPSARKDYLEGFSKRKQERRVYGLAMQKVKDRKARIEERSEKKQAIRDHVEQVEKQKADFLESLVADGIVDAAPDDDDDAQSSAKELDTVRTYQDEESTKHWGGQVVVTTSTRLPDESSDDDDDDQPHKKTKDAAQEYAGNVERFMQEIKGNLPSKKRKREHNVRHKGKHGASNMKGMGGDLKTAERMLKQAQSKHKGSGGGKHKGRRGRR